MASIGGPPVVLAHRRRSARPRPARGAAARCPRACRRRGRPAWRGRSGCHGRARRRWPAARTTSRPSGAAVASSPGHRVGQRAAVGPGPACRRLDHHDAHVALGAHGEELLGRLAVLGPGPQRGIDGEHHGVEVEPAECLEVGPRHLHVVPGDAGEAGVAGVAQRQDALQRGGAPVELGERGHGMRLVEVEDLRVEQAAGRVELIGDAVGIGPQRLAGDEELVPVRRQMRAHHRLGRPVLRRDVEVVHPAVEGQLEPLPRLFDAGGPAGGATRARRRCSRGRSVRGGAAPPVAPAIP